MASKSFPNSSKLTSRIRSLFPIALCSPALGNPSRKATPTLDLIRTTSVLDQLDKVLAGKSKEPDKAPNNCLTKENTEFFSSPRSHLNHIVYKSHAVYKWCHTKDTPNTIPRSGKFNPFINACLGVPGTKGN